ncbi:MAG: RagB/SusD family nutrient uptake outer membrane protein [Prevotellaceae bacterium]|jgi:hypothetical protein|nr:RagB/SusD family nutrient uptake outer membrane protein [Prevotellaceae bacterium]
MNTTMNIKTTIILLSSLILFSLTGCEDYLDRPQLTQSNDDNYWTDENKLRLYANGFYPRYFVGYNTANKYAYTAHNGYRFNDDVINNGTQTNFELSVPSSRGSTSASDLDEWLAGYSGPTWNFAWLRKANIMLDRIETRMGSILTAEQKNHWTGIARFFRSIDYAGLVTVFGDVPYYDHELKDTDYDDLYKPRTPRNEVMDAVYDDWKFALYNVRVDDGAMNVNRYVVASLISRLALFEGTWQKYHKNDTERARKFLSLAVEAAEVVKNSNKYSFDTEFRALFGSYDLAGSKEVIFYRHYDVAHDVLHAVAHSCNMSEGRYYNANLALVKSFLCSDGTDWQTSSDAANKDFTLSNLIATRDPRFEATFYKKLTINARSSCLYTAKFISRKGLEYIDNGTAIDQEHMGAKNQNDYPVLRYAEVLLNWIEAKAELGTLGEAPVTQADIDASINKIRDRPLHADAVAAGVKKTVAMDLSALPDSPDRGDVPQLLWEIRRERRMELAFEHSRILDLRRWKKLEYMDDTKNPDLLRGTWIDANAPELKSALLIPAEKGILAVTDMAGVVTIYDGSNDAGMVGFYSPTNIQGRLPFLNVTGVNPYLAPVGRNQRIAYQNKGYVLDQTEGWPSDL